MTSVEPRMKDTELHQKCFKLSLSYWQIMVENSTCVSGNNTSSCLTLNSAAGPPAWPVVFLLLLLLIPAGVAAYKYRSKIRSGFRAAYRRSQKKEDSNEAPVAESHPYVHRGQSSAKQMPIYENLTAQKAGGNKARLNQRR